MLAGPFSPVRMRMVSSMGRTKILPPPISLDRATLKRPSGEKDIGVKTDQGLAG
jgi:hypothetical protein